MYFFESQLDTGGVVVDPEVMVVVVIGFISIMVVSIKLKPSLKYWGIIYSATCKIPRHQLGKFGFLILLGSTTFLKANFCFNTTFHSVLGPPGSYFFQCKTLTVEFQLAFAHFWLEIQETPSSDFC